MRNSRTASNLSTNVNQQSQDRTIGVSRLLLDNRVMNTHDKTMEQLARPRFTRHEVARVVGLPPRTMARWLREKTFPPRSAAYSLMDAIMLSLLDAAEPDLGVKPRHLYQDLKKSLPYWIERTLDHYIDKEGFYSIYISTVQTNHARSKKITVSQTQIWHPETFHAYPSLGLHDITGTVLTCFGVYFPDDFWQLDIIKLNKSKHSFWKECIDYFLDYNEAGYEV